MFDSNFEFVAALGEGQGSAPGQLDDPRGIAVSNDQLLFVADSENHRISVFSADGSFVRAFGSSGDGQLRDPFGLCLERSSGFLFVADYSNNRICVFEGDGTFVKAIDKACGSAAEFDEPTGVCCDSNGSLFVGDANNCRVKAFDWLNGQFLFEFGSRGCGDGEFGGNWIHPTCDKFGRLVVSDYANHRVSLFDSDGVFLSAFGCEGKAVGEFAGPSAPAVTPMGVFVVPDYSNHRVQLITAV